MRKDNQEVLEEFFNYQVPSEDTREKYRSALQSWDKYTDTPLTELSEASLREWYQKASQELSQATIEKYGLQLRAIYTTILQQRARSFIDI